MVNDRDQHRTSDVYEIPAPKNIPTNQTITPVQTLFLLPVISSSLNELSQLNERLKQSIQRLSVEEKTLFVQHMTQIHKELKAYETLQNICHIENAQSILGNVPKNFASKLFKHAG